MKNTFIRYSCLVLSLAVMTFIFIMSHQPADVSTAQSGGFIEFAAKVFLNDFEELSAEQQEEIIISYQLLARKAAHFSVYMALAFLLSGFFHSFKCLEKACGYIFAFLIAFVFSCSDEIHQYFIPGRSCQVSDVLLDASGMIFGILVFIIFTLLIKRFRGVSSGENEIRQ
ncbi:MAG: VanZ family protein [Clostridia bacterium]|nr:VanZ family protein [Clostridia bacterium]